MISRFRYEFIYTENKQEYDTRFVQTYERCSIINMTHYSFLMLILRNVFKIFIR